MKNTIYLLIFIVFISFISFSCEKVENKPDQIVYESLNKTISIAASDSIRGACLDLIFSIKENDKKEKSAMVNPDSSEPMCDAYNEFLVTDENDCAHLIKPGEIISEKGKWSSANNLCLDQFAGKGPMFLGHRIASYPSGEIDYYYNWIRIEFSADKLILKLIDRGENMAPNNPIRAGQLK